MHDILQLIYEIIGQFLVAMLIGILAAVVVGTYRFFVPKVVHRWGKLRGKNYIILSGDPETVQLMYEVAITTGRNAEARSRQAKQEEGIPVADERNTETEA